jgi:hypothetical protein
MIRSRITVIVVLFTAACVLSSTPSPAIAQDPLADYDPATPPGTTEFALGIGYAHIAIGDGELDSENAWRFDPSLSFSPIAGLPQLRVGAAVGFSLVADNSERTLIVNNGQLTITGSSDIPLWFLEPELRLSWRQYLGRQNEFFIEPGVAAGGTFGFLSIDDDLDTAEDETFDESASTFSTRVFLRAGVRASGGFAGLEASYLRGGDMDFAENANGDLEQFYIGIFGALAF